MQTVGKNSGVSAVPSATFALAQRFWELTRAGEWWDYKIIPALALLYATAFYENAPLTSVVPAAALFILAIGIGAAFVGALNDLADRGDDRLAGKFDRIGPDNHLSWIVVTLSVVAGFVLLLSFAGRPILFWTYASGWIVFAAYSLPPLRLKGRAWAGVACDAIGAHLVPAIFAVGLMRPHQQLDPWISSVAVWSFAYGLRGILGHQIADEAADRAANLETFVVRNGAAATERLLKYLVFPVEISALAAILLLVGSPVVWIGLALSLAFVWAKVFRYRLRPVLSVSSTRQTIILADFYITFLPACLLVALALRSPPFALLLPVHLLLFPNYHSANLRELIGLYRGGTESKAGARFTP